MLTIADVWYVTFGNVPHLYPVIWAYGSGHYAIVPYGTVPLMVVQICIERINARVQGYQESRPK